MKGSLAAAWGVAGVVVLIGTAVARLSPLGLEAFSYPLRWLHWAALGAWVPFMAWTEGYRGFHRAFSPMVAARAKHLREHPETVHFLLAPIFCFGSSTPPEDERSVRRW